MNTSLDTLSVPVVLEILSKYIYIGSHSFPVIQVANYGKNCILLIMRDIIFLSLSVFSDSVSHQKVNKQQFSPP